MSSPLFILFKNLEYIILSNIFKKNKMPLNLGKVEKLLYENKFVVVGFYLYESLCRYMKLFSIETGETLMLFIASEFDFRLSEKDIGADRSVYHIKPIDFDSGADVTERYAQYPDTKTLEEKYEQDLKIQEVQQNTEENLEAQMESNYNKKIYLNDFSKDHVNILKDCFRQLKRIALSVQDLRYNICIMHETYLCCIEHEDSITCYVVSNQTTSDKRIFQVVADLEYFYEKSATINIDIESIRLGLYKVLDKNQDVNTSKIEHMMSLLLTTRPIIASVTKTKASYIKCLEKYKKLLKNSTEYELELAKKLEDQEANRDRNYFNDASYVHQKSGLESKFNSCKALRSTIHKNMEEIQTLCDNLYLMVDRTEFDSSIMVDRVIKNFSDLQMKNNFQ